MSSSAWAAITKIPWNGWLKQQTFISHSSVVREVQDQGASRFSHKYETLSPNTYTLGIRISTYEFWGEANIQPITVNKINLLLLLKSRQGQTVS